MFDYIQFWLAKGLAEILVFVGVIAATIAVVVSLRVYDGVRARIKKRKRSKDKYENL